MFFTPPILLTNPKVAVPAEQIILTSGPAQGSFLSLWSKIFKEHVNFGDIFKILGPSLLRSQLIGICVWKIFERK